MIPVLPTMMNKMLAAALIFFGLPIVASAAPSDAFAQLLLVLQSLQPEKTLGDGDTTTSAPTINLSASQSVVISGETLTLTWSSSNATSCEALGSWRGDLQTSGSLEQETYGIGERSFSITCLGGGGTTVSTPVIVRFELSPSQRAAQAAVSAAMSTF
ncbi:MAG: hypothetical protein P8M75_04465 [Luminiphilus sp.]|nr:hypothetical protein [Luminiphilus sp.]